ncbi:hypothetical protein PS623_01312 [Pseudomonas fluorescens]|uniref:alpha-xenorhabdolysin family binary toxin subunit A n=1 Tax=Pseudomonas fluorescens TaxID=294 RepID=UPI001240393D|nr:alpha-xenorhabdolysin family binary toxin subunit A [Pseudomonas fluorescens]VVM62176.1 hypothetical protein PS623_01312 [Pseudomonas fluorescens]
MSENTETPVKSGAADAVRPPTFEELTPSERAERIPQQIFDLKKDEPAFIFSKDNLLMIKRYEAAVRRLPSSREELAGTLDFAAVGLEIDDVHRFYDNLRTHVNGWDDIEDACKKMGSELQVFAETLFTEGVAFIAELKSTDAWASLENTSLNDIDLEKAPPVPLSSKDTATFKEGVDSYLKDIESQIKERLKSIRHVKALTDRFADVIGSHLKPTADGLLKAMNKKDVSLEVQKIDLELTELDNAIERKLDEYNGLVGASFYGLVFGPVGLLITGGIYGAQAEEVRAEKNTLIARREASAVRKSNLLAQSESFELTKRLIMDLQFRLVEVRTAVKNLEDVWVLLEVYVEQSLAQLEKVDTQVMLKKFVRQFQRVISPWKDILGISKTISKLFNETIVS